LGAGSTASRSRRVDPVGVLPYPILLRGQLDAGAAPTLAASVAAHCLQGYAEIRLDLGQVSTIDSTGLQALRAARRVCERRGRRFSLVCPRGRIREAVVRGGLGDALRSWPPPLRLLACFEPDTGPGSSGDE
jgi:anti-anti-sigma factor